eukprot:2230029-Rhodomonas_salina.2
MQWLQVQGVLFHRQDSNGQVTCPATDSPVPMLRTAYPGSSTLSRVVPVHCIPELWVVVFDFDDLRDNARTDTVHGTPSLVPTPVLTNSMALPDIPIGSARG